MTKVQVELSEEENKMLEMIKAQYGIKDKRQAVKILIHKYFFGWISCGGRVWQQTLLEAIIDKITNYPYWREFVSKHKKEEVIKEIKKVFDLDDTQLEQIIKRLEKEKIL